MQLGQVWGYLNHAQGIIKIKYGMPTSDQLMFSASPSWVLRSNRDNGSKWNVWNANKYSNDCINDLDDTSNNTSSWHAFDRKHYHKKYLITNSRKVVIY